MADMGVEGRAEGFAEGGVAGETFPQGQTVIDTWAAINSLVRARLLLDDTLLPDSLLDPITAATVIWLQTQYACMGAYADLGGGDLTAFNFGVSILIAAKCRAWLPKTSASGEMITYTNGATRYGYARDNHHKGMDILGRFDRSVEMEWLDEAWLMLRQVACIGAAWSALKGSFHTFALAGRQRRKQAAGYYDSHRNPLYDLRMEELLNWQDVGKAI